MTIKILADTGANDLTVTVAEGGDQQTSTVALFGVAHVADAGQAGRVIEVNNAAPGSVAQHDGTRTLRLTDAAIGLTTYPVEDGITGGVDALPPQQAKRWGDGLFFMMPRDRVTGDLIYRRGRNSIAVYITNGSHGYTKAMIAAEAGVSEATITNAWLKAHAVYGRSPAKALAMELGCVLWAAMTSNHPTGTNLKQSHHLFVERGYEYPYAWPLNVNWWSRSADGESPVHPMVVRTYGTGSAPVSIRALLSVGTPKNLAVDGMEFGDGFGVFSVVNALIADFALRGHELGLRDPQRRTLYRGLSIDATRPLPVDAGGTAYPDWAEALKMRRSGLYVEKCISALIEGMVFDHNGWAAGYTQGSIGLSGTPQPPSMFSHNVYVQADVSGVSMHDVLAARGASMGLMNRPGGTIATSAMIDNNVAGNDLGGKYGGAGPVGEFGLHYRNLITSAAFRRSPTAEGAWNWGFDLAGEGSSAIDVIIAHAANPNDPAEMAAKSSRQFGLRGTMIAHRHILERNWSGGDQNLQGLDLAALDGTTIQNFAATVLPGGTTPTIDNLMAHIRTLGPKARVDMTRAILAYFHAPYMANMEMSPVPTGAVSAIFRPDIRGEGFRWDIDLNWSTGYVPGTKFDDTVNLHGNFVRFGRVTAVVTSLTFGGGRLDVTSAKLTALAHTDAADVVVRYCGQFVSPGGTGDYMVSGGTLVFTGAANVDLEVAVDDLGQEAEVIIGPNMTIGAGKTLSLAGGSMFVGWNGSGMANLTIASGGTLSFAAVAGTISQLRRFKLNGDDPDPTVNVTLTLAAGSTVVVDATGLSAGARDLTGTGVTVVNNGATLPAGVTVTGGKLVLTV